MNLASRFALLFLALAALSPLAAQDPGAPDTLTAPPGSTIITSDELRTDENTHISVFTGTVNVVGAGFNMTCDEMTVYFTKDNKVDNIIATGTVVITQPGRTTHCGKAQYFSADDKFVLTESPDIIDSQKQLFAPEIVIYRTNQKLITHGRSKVILQNGSGLTPGAKPSAPAPPTP